MSLGSRYFRVGVAMTRPRWWREAVLTVGAAAGALCVVVAIAVVAFDARALVFRSGSMSPAIETGALALARPVPAADVSEGDVVSVRNDEGTRVTHRVVAIETVGEQARLTLKGDDNPTVDAQPYVVTSVDRVVFDVPRVGYVVSWLSGPIGLILLGGYAAFLLSVLFGRRRDASVKTTGARRTTTGVASLALLVGLGASVPAVTEPTLAQWTDTAASQSGTFSAFSVTSQAAPTCSTEGGLLGALTFARITWTHVDDRYEYEWVIRRSSNGAEQNSGVISPSSAAGSSVSFDVGTNLLSLGLGSTNLDFVVTARLKSDPAWKARSSTSTPIRTGAVVLGLNVRCEHI